MQILERAALAICIHVISQRAPAMSQRATKRELDRARESPHSFFTQLVRWSKRVNAGREQRFVHVNVAESGDQVFHEDKQITRLQKPVVGQAKYK